MPLEIKGYRVFIASPGGLEEERRAFRDTLAEYNAAEAIHDNVQFYPVGWEDTLAGIGRPQALINEDVRKCDFFVLLLWDRWGSDPGGGSAYTSGTEEEFNIALECRRDDSHPMRQIVVLFKAVDPRQLSDPGEQLSKVLEFKRTLEKEKQHLYQTFDTSDAFKNLLRRHLGAWLRLRNDDLPPALAALPSDPPPSDTPRGSGADVNELILGAVRLANEGKRTDAEALFAKATVGRIDPEGLIAYARFLYRDGRWSQALTFLESALDAARTRGSPATEADALRSIGDILYTRGDLDSAKQMYLDALKIDEVHGSGEGQAADYSNLGKVLRTRGDLDGAEQMLRKSLEIDEQLGKVEGQATTYGRLGLVLQSRGDFGGAEQMHRKALAIAEQSGSLDRQAAAYGNLGNVLYRRGDLDGAEKMHHKALSIHEHLGSLTGQANAYGNLGNVLHWREDLDGAEQMYRKALEIDERLGRLQGQANAYGGLGRLLDKRGDLDGAEQMHRKALEIDKRLGKLEGQAADYGNIGNVLLQRGDLDGAEQMYRTALEINERLGRLEGQAIQSANLGNVLFRRHDLDGAEHFYQKALEIDRKIGVTERIQEILVALKGVEQARHSASAAPDRSVPRRHRRTKPRE
jgi:tetratricopeptide (TPR) repeat protein